MTNPIVMSASRVHEDPILTPPIGPMGRKLCSAHVRSPATPIRVRSSSSTGDGLPPLRIDLPTISPPGCTSRDILGSDMLHVGLLGERPSA